MHFRRVFAEWGLPEKIRVDNGAPWGSWSDLPPVLALWLIGLGIEVWWNTPRRPQENGVIEHSQGLAKRWGEPNACKSTRQFQSRINHEDYVQREVYPSIHGKPRITVFPELRHSGRRYSIRREQRQWDWQRVLTHLSGYAVRRQVDSAGKIGIYGSKLYVGVIHKRKSVYVQFDPDRIEWIVSDPRGNQLRSLPATEMKPHRVRTMKLKSPQG
jgi:hypothetical protein